MFVVSAIPLRQAGMVMVAASTFRLRQAGQNSGFFGSQSTAGDET
jgi:hypothetical protein